MMNAIIIELQEKIYKPMITNIGIAVPYIDNKVIIKSNEVFDYPMVILWEEEQEKLFLAIFNEEFKEDPQPELEDKLTVKTYYDVAMFIWYIFSYKIHEATFYIELSFTDDKIDYINIGIDKKTKKELSEKLYREPVSVVRIKNRYMPNIVRPALEDNKSLIYKDFCLSYDPYESILFHHGILDVENIQKLLKTERISIEELKNYLNLNKEPDIDKIQDLLTHARSMLNYVLNNIENYKDRLHYGYMYFFFKIRKVSKFLFHMLTENKVEVY